MKLTLPLPLNLANSRMHWRPKHSAKLEYWAMLDQRQMLNMIPPPPAEPFESVTIEATWYLHGTPMDEDNAYARLKWPTDWLVSRGYIRDDKAKNVRLLPPAQKVDRKNKRLELVITVAPLSRG